MVRVHGHCATLPSSGFIRVGYALVGSEKHFQNYCSVTLIRSFSDFLTISPPTHISIHVWPHALSLMQNLVEEKCEYIETVTSVSFVPNGPLLLCHMMLNSRPIYPYPPLQSTHKSQRVPSIRLVATPLLTPASNANVKTSPPPAGTDE